MSVVIVLLHTHNTHLSIITFKTLQNPALRPGSEYPLRGYSDFELRVVSQWVDVHTEVSEYVYVNSGSMHYHTHIYLAISQGSYIISTCIHHIPYVVHLLYSVRAIRVENNCQLMMHDTCISCMYGVWPYVC